MWVHNTESDYVESHACNLHFKCTNNIAEYEALILGLTLLKKLGARRITAHGDSDLIIKQVNGEYTAKHPRLRAYSVGVNAYIPYLRSWFVMVEKFSQPLSLN